MVANAREWRALESIKPPESDSIFTRTLAGGDQEVIFDVPSTFLRGNAKASHARKERALPSGNGLNSSFSGARVVQIGFRIPSASVEAPYAQASWIKTAVKAFVGGFIQLRPKVMDRAPSDPAAKELEVPVITRLLAMPNAAMIQEELMEALGTDYKLGGESTWFVQGADGQPIKHRNGLWVEDPAQLIPAPKRLVELAQDESTGMPAKYRYKTGAKIEGKAQGYFHEYDQEAVIVFRDYNPDNVLRGLGDVEVAAPAIQLYLDGLAVHQCQRGVRGARRAASWSTNSASSHTSSRPAKTCSRTRSPARAPRPTRCWTTGRSSSRTRSLPRIGNPFVHLNLGLVLRYWCARAHRSQE